jgi:hypothetical protein
VIAPENYAGAIIDDAANCRNLLDDRRSFRLARHTLNEWQAVWFSIARNVVPAWRHGQ